MSTSTRPPNPASVPQTVPIPPSTAATLLASFTTFLTLALHSLLYHRGLYPPATFLTARALNLPVHQSRHPGLCAWINDAVAAAAVQLRAGTARRVAVAMHAPKSLVVLERWVFDVEAFPASWGDAGMGETDNNDDGPADAQDQDAVNWTDVNEALRGALRRIAYAGETMPALPEGSTFTLAVELRDEAPAPIGHPQHWIPSQPNLQPPTKSSPDQGSSLGGASTMPIRSVRAGPLFFECWVEQGPDPSS
ncbi:HORMA domain-containing protein [Dactylonectria estremocensis]|uniref:HORMA domain-containing protein n=1 Tax=Dactylonectria estremocensis TaxID=1079267 RepID=A0A9P9J589_9HYPO|nr:HORMA domain-containing protein [Dactylonectria estremocensis]